jgi:hypothetical protein
MRTITKSEKAAAQVVFDGLVKDYEIRSATSGGPPLDHNVYKALWHRAHGADAVIVIDDPDG